MKSLFGILWLVLASSDALGKCASDTYEIFGVVRDVEGKVASGARLDISYRDNVWFKPHAVKIRADGMGAFDVTLQYYPYSGNSGLGDECKSSLKTVDVVVTYNGKTSRFASQDIRGARTNLNFRVIH